jgi:alpha-amylase
MTRTIFRYGFLCMLPVLMITGSCRIADRQGKSEKAPFLWNNANIYFLLTDRFFNGNPDNDINFDRTGKTAVMRGFQGGDMAGVIEKMNEGYFDSLGITALWLTPWFEQIHGCTDEGTGVTYGYHGYWTRDWTSLDPNFGTEAELEALVETAHSRGIRIIMDVIINHTGPVTEQDPAWPPEWVRLKPPCEFKSYETTVPCTLVRNLPDIRTDSDSPVDLPAPLLEKWEAEGRLEMEMTELDHFFERTGFPRAPRYYIIKWLTDYIRKYGIDGFRLDTAKHIEESVWKELFGEARLAFLDWKRENPDKVLDENEFYMVGEVYNWGITAGRLFNFGEGYEKLFSSYSGLLNSALKGHGVLNYLTSHDDGDPFDRERMKPMEAGTKLLLAPGACQIYYGDESCRTLTVQGANGDANLRGLMNWDEIEGNAERNGFRIREVTEHYGKLGRFRRDHPAVGAGIHQMVSEKPYLFSRIITGEAYSDRVLVGLELPPGIKKIAAGNTFPDGTELHDYYSGENATVRKGFVTIHSEGDIVLLGQK